MCSKSRENFGENVMHNQRTDRYLTILSKKPRKLMDIELPSQDLDTHL